MSSGASDLIDTSTSTTYYSFLGKSVTKTEGILIIVSGIAILALIVSSMAIGIALGQAKSSNDDASVTNKDECVTSECLWQASFTRRAMNPSADPCKDFYEFSCGAWANSRPVHNDHSIRDVTTDITDANIAKLQGLLEDDASKDSFETGKKVKIFFQSCMKDYEKMKQGADPFLGRFS